MKALRDENITVLVERVKEGDDVAFEELVRLYTPLIESSTARFSASLPPEVSSAETEELRQDARLALYRAAMTYNCEKYDISFGLFAKICIRNYLISSIRKIASSVRRSKRAKAGITDEQIHGNMSVQNGVGNIGSLSAFGDETLSRYEKEVFYRYAAGQKPREIAASMNRDVKSVHNAICRIKAKLKRELDV